MELRSPPVSSALRWVFQLSSRLSSPIKSFQALQHPIIETEDAQMLLLRYNNLIERLKRFEKEIFEKWAEKVPNQIEMNLKKSLLIRLEESKIIKLNFDPELSEILREVHYLRLMHKENIPQCGLAFSEEQEVYRSYILNLEKSIEWYNSVSSIKAIKTRGTSSVRLHRNNLLKCTTFDRKLKVEHLIFIFDGGTMQEWSKSCRHSLVTSKISLL